MTTMLCYFVFCLWMIHSTGTTFGFLSTWTRPFQKCAFNEFGAYPHKNSIVKASTRDRNDNDKGKRDDDILALCPNERYEYRLQQLRELYDRYYGNQNNTKVLDDDDRVDYVKLAQLEKNEKLVAWVRTQQYEYQLYRKKKQQQQQQQSSPSNDYYCYSSFLTNERKEKLEELRMDWNYDTKVAKLQQKWMFMFHQLQNYQQQHGHTRVTKKQNKSLAIWIKNQKAAYRKYQKENPHASPNNQNATTVSTLNDNPPSTIETSSWKQQRIKNLEQFHSLIHHDSIYNHTWMEYYQQYKLYSVNINNNSPATETKQIISDGLKNWILSQRRNYRCFQKYGSGMNPERIDLLNHIQFDWNGREFLTSHHPTIRRYNISDGSQQQQQQQSWEDILHQLQLYKRTHGDLAISTSHPVLGNWAHNIRAEYRNFQFSNSQQPKQKLSKKLEALDQIGFVWNVHDYQWNKKYQTLLLFYKTYGHTNVPVTKSNVTLQTYLHSLPNNDHKNDNSLKDLDDIISLGYWTRRQRQWYRNQIKDSNTANDSLFFTEITDEEVNNSSAMNSANKRMQALTLLFGEDIRLKKYESKWEHMFQQLLEFQRQSPDGNCLVPRQYPKNPKLTNWVSEQRRQYHQSTLANQRIKKLESIGFIWNVRRGPKKIIKETSSL